MAGARRHSVFHPLRVASVERLTDDAVAVTFDVPPELREEFRFQAGQHVSIRSPVVGDDVRRNYSICAPATDGEQRLRIGVKRIPDGVFSGYVAERLQPGDVLDIMTPTGTFSTVLHPGQRKRYGAIAAGSGITPVLSILSTALEVEPGSSAVLVYVNRTTLNIMFLEDLEDLKNRYPDRFQLIHVLDEEPLDVEILSGRLDADRLGRILDHLVLPDDVDEWFLCGPLPMTDVARGVLLAYGADDQHIHRELFFVGPPPAAGSRTPAAQAAEPETGAEVTVMLDGRSQTFVLPEDGASILDATLRYRADAPFACKNGVCGTCRAKVTEGKVRMDANYALEPADVAAGYALACQSHPAADRVVLDFDQ
ncbi:MAG TPA: 1,2-phenylacetyl-CoA epoxidase subunit PaaE [Streptosporangiaceae bacterium]|nr:1,2-phenylacetyl-CoA epoxidase subunit PaaE [Streptosporangiaceae bacterium]